MKRFPLHIRLLALLFGTLAILVGANAWWLAREEAHQVAAGAEAKAAYLLDVFIHHILPDGHFDMGAVTQEVGALANDPEIAALVVVDAAGRVSAASRREWLGEQATDHVPDFARAKSDALRSQPLPPPDFDAATHSLVAWAPVSPPRAGSVQVDDSAVFLALDVTARQQAAEQRVIRQLLRESSIAIIYLVLLFAFLARCVVTPLASIRRQMQSFSPGEFQHLDVKVGAREIIEAVEMFNALQAEWNDLRQRMFHATLAFEASREGITITDATGRIEQVNPAFTAITGYTAAEAVGQTPRILQSGRQSAEFYAAMWQAIAAQGFWAGEIWNRRKNGQLWPEWLSISAARDENGTVTHYVGVFTDLSEIKAAESRAEALAWNSPLVGLPNRTFLLARLKEATALIGDGQQRGFAVLLVNLRGFQRINASFGIETGDAVLTHAARRIEAVAAGHLTCHMESDEFAVFLNSDISQEEAAHFAAAVLEQLDISYGIEDSQVVLGAAIGIALCPADGLTVSQLMRQADSALDAARHESGSSYRFASVDLTERARARLDLENRLRRALAANELRVFFQPQVEVRHNRIVGAEALVRWQDPQRGLIPPNDFIPVAEDSGLIIELGRQVLFETCRHGAAWRASGLSSLKLAVNVAARQWAAPEFVDSVMAALEQTGYPANGLVLELTESTLMSGTEALMPQLRHLREMGIELSIDDFGTGYSSLAYLQHFPVNELKIDKSFVDRLTERQSDRQIAAAIVALGHAMRLDVLAEGVETAAQLEWLENLGVDRWQGYLKSRPLPAEEFEALLRSESR